MSRGRGPDQPLKRRYGLTRSRLKGGSGATIWVSYGILAHNLYKMVALG